MSTFVMLIFLKGLGCSLVNDLGDMMKWRSWWHDEVKTSSRIIEEIKDTSRLWVSAGAKHLAILVDRTPSE